MPNPDMSRGLPDDERRACLLIRLDETDSGYAYGYRYRLDQVDGSEMYAVDRDRADYLMQLHGLRHVDAPEMVRIRKAMLKRLLQEGKQE